MADALDVTVIRWGDDECDQIRITGVVEFRCDLGDHVVWATPKMTGMENEVRLTSESPITLEVTRKGAKIRTSWSR